MFNPITSFLRKNNLNLSTMMFPLQENFSLQSIPAEAPVFKAESNTYALIHNHLYKTEGSERNLVNLYSLLLEASTKEQAFIFLLSKIKEQDWDSVHIAILRLHEIPLHFRLKQVRSEISIAEASNFLPYAVYNKTANLKYYFLFSTEELYIKNLKE